jgi:HSP20 family protein
MAKSAKKKTRGKTAAERKKESAKRSKGGSKAAPKASGTRSLRYAPETVWGDLPELFRERAEDGWPRWPSLFDPGSRLRAPAIDIIDHEKELVVRAEVPGVDKNDLEVSVADRMLTIKATSRSEKEEKGDDYYRQEIRSGAFSRSVLLPTDVDVSKADGRFDAGVLELHLPKVRISERRTIPLK